MDRGLIAGCLISLCACGGTAVPAPAAPVVRVAAHRAVVVPGEAVVVAESRPPDLDLRCEDERRCPAGVGMLVTPLPDELERCTAALVAPDRMLTAAHCLPPDVRRAGASCHGSWVRFAASEELAAQWVECDEVVEALAVDDAEVLRQDHAVIRLRRAVARPAFPVEGSAPGIGSIVTVVSVTPHPVYGTQHEVETRLCRVSASDVPVYVLGAAAATVGWLRDCEIVPGHSGSPVLDHEGRIRAIVHGGSARAFAMGITSDVPAAARN